MPSLIATIPNHSFRLPRTVARLADIAGGVPLLRGLLSLIHTRYFNNASGHIRLFRGIYADFSSASRDIPDTRLLGYDNEASAHRLKEERFRITPSDYPVMFWLSRLLPECRLLFDWGGNVGISYFGYRHYLDYAPQLTWLINDVPSVVALGRTIAAEESASGLDFTTALDPMANADILLAGGSMQFIDDPFAALRSVRSLPRHILVNKAPVYQHPAAVTLQNMGTAICPNHLFNRNEFVRQFALLGYRMIDEWAIPGLSCRIPFFRSHSIAAYSGFYFRKEQSGN